MNAANRFPGIPPQAPVSVFVTRNQLRRHIRRYMSALVEPGSTTKGEAAVVKDKAANELDFLVRKVTLIRKKRNFRGRVAVWIGLIFFGLIVVELKSLGTTTRAIGKALEKIRQATFTEIFVSMIQNIFVKYPTYWLFGTIGGYYLMQDVRQYLAFRSIKASIYRMLQKVEQGEPVEAVDLEVLEAEWKWKILPWDDYRFEEEYLAIE